MKVNLMLLESYKVSFRVRSPSMDPIEIASGLGLEPKWFHKAGAARRTPKGTRLEGVYDENYCTFPINSRKGECLSDLLSRFARELKQRKNILNDISRSGGRCEFFIGWFSSANTGELFPCELLTVLGSLNIDLAIDIYCDENSPNRILPP